MNDRDRLSHLETHLNYLYKYINSENNHKSLKRLKTELGSAISTIETRLNQEWSKELSDYSAKELTSMTHWTSKDDLRKALGNNSSLASDQTIDNLWLALTSADRGLQQFYPGQLVTIIEYKENQK